MIAARPSTKPVSFTQRLKEIGMFFEGKDEVHKSLRRLVRRLERAKIPYAVVGGMAVNAHGYRRTTGDIKILLAAQGLAAFQQRFVPKNYQAIPDRSRRFVDRTNDIGVDMLVAGLFPGSGKRGPIAYPDPAPVGQLKQGFRVVNLETLVELKLAARRHKDFGDVVDLIRFNNLDEAFLPRLHRSVRNDFIECLEEKRREDEYEARNG
jgi:hypothetical protein